MVVILMQRHNWLISGQRFLVVLGNTTKHEHASRGLQRTHFQLGDALQLVAFINGEIGHGGRVTSLGGINCLWGNGVSSGHGLGFLDRVKNFKGSI